MMWSDASKAPGGRPARPPVPSRADGDVSRGGCREDWPMGRDFRADVLEALRTALGRAAERRPSIMAAQALMAAGHLNLKQQALDVAGARLEHLKAAEPDAAYGTIDAAAAARALAAALDDSERDEYRGDE
jgi:hypothetical protein